MEQKIITHALEIYRQGWLDAAPTTEVGKRSQATMITRINKHGDYVVAAIVKFVSVLPDIRREMIIESIGHSFHIDYAVMTEIDQLEAARRFLERGIEYARMGHDGNIDNILELAEIELWQAYAAHIEAGLEEQRWILS